MSNIQVQFTGYAPDLDPTTQGIIMDCSNLVPDVDGYQGAAGTAAVGLPALAAACQAAAVIKKVDDSQRLFAATRTKLYESAATSWTDVSKGAGSYTGGADTRWRFAQFGNDTIAVNKADPPQVSASGAFADLGGTPPKASIVEVVNGFVMLADYNDGSNDYADGWWCSALRNDGSWAASIATQAANGRLLDSPGPIKGLKKLGNNCVAYKDKSIYLGFYDGPPVIWRWELVPGEIGAVSHEAVVSIGTAHIFAGYDDFYLFDGSRPISIGASVRNFYVSDINSAYRYKTIANVDHTKGLVYFRYPSTNSVNGAIDRCLVYNYRLNMWGRDDRNVEACLEYFAAGLTFDGLGTNYSTWDNLPTTISFDSPFWTGNTALPAIIDTTHTLYSLTAACTGATLTTGWMGDDGEYTTLTKVRPKFTSDMTTAVTGIHHWTNLLGKSYTAGSAVTMNDRKIDFGQSSRWHRVVFNFTGDFGIVGFKASYIDDGEA